MSISGGSCHKCRLCRDKHMFRVCRDKTRRLSRQKLYLLQLQWYMRSCTPSSTCSRRCLKTGYFSTYLRYNCGFSSQRKIRLWSSSAQSHYSIPPSEHQPAAICFIGAFRNQQELVSHFNNRREKIQEGYTFAMNVNYPIVWTTKILIMVLLFKAEAVKGCRICFCRSFFLEVELWWQYSSFLV